MNAAKRPIPASSQLSRTLPQALSPAQTSLAPAQQTGSLQAAQPTEPRHSYRPKRVPFAGARRAIALESSVKLTVNLLLAIIASTTIAKLVPYYQVQQEQLGTLQDSVAQAEKKNAELRDQFSRNFDPAQTSRIMQEQSGMGYPNQRKVIWTQPLD
ncbi:MAG: hypothetical protein AAF716_03080 [Cyanobacteria bacterium P01_D01_bin.1]